MFTAAALDYRDPPLDVSLSGNRLVHRNGTAVRLGRQEQSFVRLSAKFSKNGKLRDQLIRADLADWLREWLHTRPDAGPIWRALPHARLSLRFRRDMEAARGLDQGGPRSRGA